LVVLGVAVGTMAGYSAYAKRQARPASEDLAQPQLANRAAKTDRLAFIIPSALASPGEGAKYALASAPQGADLERFTDVVRSANAVAPRVEDSKPPEVKQAALAPAPLPHERPKRLLPPPPAPPAASNLLDDHQIAGLKGRLRLTSDQIEYWPAVETALRDVVRTQLRGTVKPAHGGRANIDVNSPEVQKLIWAAMPLLMRLREDQKSEVRKLARVIGLEQVASQI
jgi:hypothetical protein